MVYNADPWRGFARGAWADGIDVGGFMLQNVSPYEGGGEFLRPASERTLSLKAKLDDLLRIERERGGVLSIDPRTVSSLTAYAPGYLDRDSELIVGLQTDEPLKRGINPFGGIRMAREACEAYGYALHADVEREFLYRTTHNDGVFRAYTAEMRAARKARLITGLPDAYGRGRIIGDYRRIALYGADYLIERKLRDKAAIGEGDMDADAIRLSEELFQQIEFLRRLKEMAASYGYDISVPAKSAREAIQWTYFAYLGAIKEQNGAATSLGRVNGFFDIYIERDIAEGAIDEGFAQELIDQFALKLRMARMLRTPDYNELFGGDPMWITECLGGMAEDGRTLVSKTAYRFLHTLYTLSPAPEPNITVLWSKSLPEAFKRYCAAVSVDTDSIQYESDDLMRPIFGSDYGISCCVSAMRIGKQTQYFGARCNLPKLLLLAINGGYDADSGARVGPAEEPLGGDVLDYNEVLARFVRYRAWLCRLYVNTMNAIHYMHDKYAYEKIQMALHDTFVERFMAFGIAGLSVTSDSLSAIKYAKVRPIRGEGGYVAGFETSGEYPAFGNDDDRADDIARELADGMIAELREYPAYRGARHTLSALTITSNVVYGKSTGATPDGRAAGEPFAPGANPMHGREEYGAIASLNSVAKLPYDSLRDGVSNTFTIAPEALGADREARVLNLCDLLDGYFAQGAHHLNVNVLSRDRLVEAMESPESHPNLTIRVSGYAVNFHKLSRVQQSEVLGRTFHASL